MTASTVHSKGTFYEIIDSQEMTREQEWQKTSSSEIFWRRIKLASKIIATNAVGISLVVGGIFTFNDALNREDQCINGTAHNEYYDSYQCTEITRAFVGGLMCLAGGAAEVAQMIFYFDPIREFTAKNSPENISSIRNRISNSAIPVSFESLGGEDLVALNIIPRETATNLREFFARYCQNVRAKERIIDDRTHNLQVDLGALNEEEEQLIEEGQILSDKWEAFKLVCLASIVNPLLV